MRPLALKWRVSLLVGATILVGMVLAAVVAYAEIREALTADMDRTLAAMASSAMVLLADSGDAVVSEAEVRAIVGSAAVRKGLAYRIWLDGATRGPLASAAHADVIDAAALASMQPPSQDGRVFFDVGQGETVYRAVWERSALQQGTANVVIGLSRHPGDEVLEEFRDTFLYAAGTIVIVIIAVTTLLVSVGLRPITRTARDIGAVTGENVGNARIEPGRTPPELAPFVRAVTEMLTRLAAALEKQKRFVSDASHELRTPLSIARSTVDVTLFRDRTPDQYRIALGELSEDLDRMAAIVADLLLMARLDETPAAREPETFDMAELVEEVTDAFSAAPAGRQGGLALDLQPVTVRGDRAQIGRLLTNLVDNAFRHGPEGGTVSVSAGAAEGDTVQVRVCDEGGGIPAEDIPHLFERFYRTDRSRARATGGVGLGLSIAREIARRHGGDITVASTPDDGTCFIVRLPAA